MTRNETTKPDKPATKEAEKARADRTRAEALDERFVDTSTASPEDAERKRLRDAAAATSEGVDADQLIEVDANRVEFKLVGEGPDAGTLQAERLADPTADVPPDIIKVDPRKVRYSSIDPSNGPAPTVQREPLRDALGIEIPAVSPPEAFRQDKAKR